MNRTNKGLIVAIVACGGLWGCSQTETKTSSAADRKIKSLEAKCGDLETECANMKSAREDVEKRLTAMEKERSKLVKELDAYKLVMQERDELKAQLSARTGERDAMHVQLEELRKGIRTLLTRVDAALAVPGEEQHKTSTGPKL